VGRAGPAHRGELYWEVCRIGSGRSGFLMFTSGFDGGLCDCFSVHTRARSATWATDGTSARMINVFGGTKLGSVVDLGARSQVEMQLGLWINGMRFMSPHIDASLCPLFQPTIFSRSARASTFSTLMC